MKKLLIILFTLISFNTFAVEKKTTFTQNLFNEAQKNGKIVVINSWNKSCSTCAQQIKVLNEAEKEFKDILFLSYEQTANTDVAELLNIDFWTTIVVYKNNIEVSRSIGQTDKSKIYSLIKKGI
jgi:thiol-disulfide isomerase/thioredoxin